MWTMYKVLGGVFGEKAQFTESKLNKYHQRGVLSHVSNIRYYNGKYELEFEKEGFIGPLYADFVPTFLKNIESIQQVDENKATDIKSAIGWGIVGGLATGGIGLLAGAMIGGRNKKFTTFEIRFKDGTYFICECRSNDYPKLLADAGMQYAMPHKVDEENKRLID